MKQTLFLLLSIFFQILPAAAGSTDSLKQLLQNAPTDSLRVLYLNELSEKMTGFKADSALVLAKEANSLSLKINHQQGQCESMNSIAYAYMVLGKIDSSLLYLKKMVILAKEIDYVDGLAGAYGGLGFIYEKFGKMDSSIYYVHEGRKLSQRLKDTINVCKAYHNLGITYYRMGQMDSAWHYVERSIETAASTEDEETLSHILNAVASLYQEEGKTNKAKELYIQKLAISRKLGNPRDVAITLGNLGNLYAFTGNFEKGFQHIKEAEGIYRQINDRQGLAKTLNNLGSIHLHNKLFEIANDYLLQSLDIYTEIEDYREMGMVLHNLGSSSEKQKNFEKAKEYYLKSIDLKKNAKDPYGVANTKGNLGRMLWKNGDTEAGREILIEALIIAREIHQKENISYLLIDLASIDLEKDKPSAAIEKAEEAFLIAKNLNYPDLVLKSAAVLESSWKIRGNYTKAYFYIEEAQNAQDSLNSVDHQKLIANMSAKYEATKKEQEIVLLQKEKEVQNADLKKQKTTQKALLTGLAGLLSFIFFGFRAYRLIRKEKSRSEALLLNILPYKVAEELKEKGKATARQHPLVTVLFTDFKGFTQISEQLSPEELVAEIDYCYRAFDLILDKYKVEKIKTIGDAYMAAHGFEEEDKGSVAACVFAALEIRDFIDGYIISRKANGKPCFEIRIGLHCGPVVAGVVGSRKFAFDIWGDTVNIASRMESSGETGKVNISDKVRELLGEQFSYEARGFVEAKNKGELKMFFVEKKETQ